MTTASPSWRAIFCPLSEPDSQSVRDDGKDHIAHDCNPKEPCPGVCIRCAQLDFWLGCSIWSRRGVSA